MKENHLSVVLLQLCLYTILSRDMRPGDTSHICLFMLGELERSKDSTLTFVRVLVIYDLHYWMSELPCHLVI